MRVYEKLRLMRKCKGWTQEQLAERIYLAVNTYAKIERGEVDIKLGKLEKIAEILGVDIQELLAFKEKNVMNFAENCHDIHNNVHQENVILLTETQCAHELEKANLIIAQKNKEIAHLEEIIELLKKDVRS
ncbi:hypothetical protein TI05_04605 [Achromatium sp. WMS3]|nr:hypothetical protein TI05_04605 [Achromatium sp. WMS3]